MYRSYLFDIQIYHRLATEFKSNLKTPSMLIYTDPLKVCYRIGGTYAILGGFLSRPTPSTRLIPPKCFVP